MSEQDSLFPLEDKPIDKKAVYTTESMQRRDDLNSALRLLKESRSTVGTAYITSANKDYSRIDQYPGGIDRTKENSLSKRELAHTKFIRACGNCALLDCSMRESWPKFLKKYDGKVGDRKEANKNSQDLITRLGDNPTAPC